MSDTIVRRKYMSLSRSEYVIFKELFREKSRKHGSTRYVDGVDAEVFCIERGDKEIFEKLKNLDLIEDLPVADQFSSYCLTGKGQELLDQGVDHLVMKALKGFLVRLDNILVSVVSSAITAYITVLLTKK